MKRFIKKVCDILKIQVPKISYDNSMFPTKTTLAMTDFETLYFRNRARIKVYLATRNKSRFILFRFFSVRKQQHARI